MIPYTELADGFSLFANLRTKLPLPRSRETVLHFFEAIRKGVPGLSHFRSTDEAFLVENDANSDWPRSVLLGEDHLCSQSSSPDDENGSDQQHSRILELAPYHLGISAMDCEVLEVGYRYDLEFAGNQDELLAGVLSKGSPTEALLHPPNSQVLFFQPSWTLVHDDTCRLQSTVAIQTRTDAFQIATGNYPESALSIFLTVQRYWAAEHGDSFSEDYARLREFGAELIANHIGPSLIEPIVRAIAARR